MQLDKAIQDLIETPMGLLEPGLDFGETHLLATTRDCEHKTNAYKQHRQSEDADIRSGEGELPLARNLVSGR